MNYYDISPEISEEIGVWPGDVPYRRKISVDFKTGGNLLLSAFESTVHLGAHADAPNHYHPKGEGISSRSLEYYLGPCQVVSLSLPQKSRILPRDLTGIKITQPRVLFKTGSFPHPNQWNTDFVSLSAELIPYLASQGVKLVGIDTPSVDLSDDPVLESHQAIFQHNMAILEGIILSEVPDGVYTLIALPLKLRDVDASPVRAILLDSKGVLI